MATNGPVPDKNAPGRPPLPQCSLCGSELPRSSPRGPKLTTCPSCGLDFRRVREVRPQTVAARPSPPDLSADDPLNRWLAGDAIAPEASGDWQRLRRWARRHPWKSTAALVALCAEVVLPIAAWVAYSGAAGAKRQAVEERVVAEQRRDELTDVVARKEVALQASEDRWRSQLQLNEQLQSQLAEWKSRCEEYQQSGQAAERRLERAVRGVRLSVAEQLSGQAQAVQGDSPAASLFLAAQALSIAQQAGVPPFPAALQQVCDLLAPTGGAELSGHEGPVAALAASPGGKFFASGDHRGTVRLWTTTSVGSTDGPNLLEGHWERISQLVFTADNRWLISASADSTVRIWDLQATDPAVAPFLLRSKRRRIISMAVSDNGRWLAIASVGVGSDRHAIRLWDLQATDVLASAVDLPAHEGQLRVLAISGDGRWSATGDEDGSVRLWQFSDDSHTASTMTLRMHDHPVRDLRFSPNGRWLVSTGGDGGAEKNAVRAWNLVAASPYADVALAGEIGNVELSAMTADGNWFVAAGDGSLLRAWNLAKIDQQTVGTPLSGQSEPVKALAASSNGQWIATAGADNLVRLWCIGSDGPLTRPVTIRVARGQLTSITFAGDGDVLAVGNDLGDIQLWNLEVNELVRSATARILR